MSVCETTVTIHVRITAPNHDAAIQMADRAAISGALGISVDPGVTTSQPHIERVTRSHTAEERHNVAVAALQAALRDTTIPHHLTGTRPHDRAIQDAASALGVTDLTRAEISAALIEGMPR